MYDYIIKNALVYSGLNEKPKKVTVGITEDRIEIFEDNSNLPEAKKTIDATGLFLAPGFIDPHASTGFGYFFPNAANHKLYQGITTEIFGNCGTSPAPIGEHLVDTMERLATEIEFPFEWRSLSEYFEQIKGKLQFNVATLIGHSTLRSGHMDNWKELKPEQLTAMKADLDKSMKEGALGLSTGLIYSPGCFAEIDEIIELAKTAAKNGGIYASHIRDERNKVEESISEALTVSKKANIRTLISHLKAAEKQNWGKTPKIINQIENFNKENPEIQAAIDVYPYTAISTKLKAFIPTYILKDGIAKIPKNLRKESVLKDIDAWIIERDYDLDQMMIISDEFKEYFGKTIFEIAKEQKQTLGQAISEILTKSTETWVVYHCINQDDIDTAILWKNAMICTDSWSYPINAPVSIGQPHPRSYGAFTEYLERYVKNMSALTWEEAIHKITYLPAKFFNIKSRGQIKSGYFADLVLLNPEELKANSTYTHPRELSSGVEYLWVNGKLVIEEKEICDSTPGEILV